MDGSTRKSLLDIIEKNSGFLKTLYLYVVCNKKTHQTDCSNFSKFDVRTEYLSDIEFEQVDFLLNKCMPVKGYFFNESDFIKFICDNEIDTKNIIVYNSAQSGTGIGRKSLIPAFCAHKGIIVTGSNTYSVALCRHKYHAIKLLECHGFRVPDTYLHDKDWCYGKPLTGEKYIIKPLYESASIGIDSDSIIQYNESSIKTIQSKENELKQPVIVQDFIEGYEIEVPCVAYGRDVWALPPVGIALNNDTRIMGNNILDYQRVYFDNYRFFDIGKHDIDVAGIKSDAQAVVRMLGLSGLCRVDFRMTTDGQYYITDISTNPHFIQHSSVNYAFSLLSLLPETIAGIILSCAIQSKLLNYSDQN